MAYVPSIGVEFSLGSGVVKATGLSNSNPFHKLVGVVVIDGLSVAVGAACVALPQEMAKNIPMIEIIESAKRRDLRDFMVAPLKAFIGRASRSQEKSGPSDVTGSFPSIK